MATGEFFRQVELPYQKSQNDAVLFPAVLSPNPTTAESRLSVLEDAIRAHKPWLESLLQKTGAILFRGFPLSSPSDFNDVVEAFGFPEAIYVGGRAPRIKVLGRVYTANEYPPDKGIPFHHEMAYVPDFPSKVFFFCEEEPGKGGETPIVLSHIIYEKMKEKHPEFVARLEEHGLTYIKVTSDKDDPSSFTGSGWKTAYMTDDKKIAQERCESSPIPYIPKRCSLECLIDRAAKLGTKLEWMGDSAKIITGPLPAIRFNKESGRKTWFNSLAVSYSFRENLNTSVELGNGEVVPDDAMEDYMKILEEECVAIPWKKGDVLLVNNLMVLHGRRPLLKPPRRILASLCK